MLKPPSPNKENIVSPRVADARVQRNLKPKRRRFKNCMGVHCVKDHWLTVGAFERFLVKFLVLKLGLEQSLQRRSFPKQCVQSSRCRQSAINASSITCTPGHGTKVSVMAPHLSSSFRTSSSKLTQ